MLRVRFSSSISGDRPLAGRRAAAADLARKHQIQPGRLAGFGGRLSPCRSGSAPLRRSSFRTAPALFLLYHAIRIFSSFAKGAVFAAKPIAHIRAAGFWTILWAFAPSAAQFILEHHIRMKFEPALLAFGIATFIAAHVMGEAQRIADENASIL